MEATTEKYQVANGTSYHIDTPQAVIDTLEHARHNNMRVRVWYGDTETGKAWDEEYDVIGTIGRSTGMYKIPLMIHNARSYGGPGILDNCIIRIDIIQYHFTRYKHPNFNAGKWTIEKAVSEGYAEAAYKDSSLVAQFRKPGQAQRYIDFMLGNRYSK